MTAYDIKAQSWEYANLFGASMRIIRHRRSQPATRPGCLVHDRRVRLSNYRNTLASKRRLFLFVGC